MPAQVEVVVEAGDEQGDVDVRGDDLLVVEAGRPRRLRVRRPSAWRHGCDAAGSAAIRASGIEGDPVADGREVGRASAAKRNRPDTAGRSPAAVAHDRGLPVDGDDPGRTAAPGRERREGLRPAGVPAEALGAVDGRDRRHLSRLA